MDFWLTDEDKGLVGVHSSRDPLGILPIWSNRGRRIVRHLTEYSADARGFQVLVTSLALYEEYLARKQTYVPPEQFFILMEQAFAGCVFKGTGEWNLPGAIRVSARHQLPTTLGLDPQYWILGNELSNGVWGIYRGAARRAGILEEKGHRLSDRFLRDIQRPSPILSQAAMRRLFKRIDNAMESPKGGVILGGGTIQEELTAIYNNLPQKETLREYLYRPGDIEHRLVTYLAKAWQNPEEFSHREFFESCREEFPDMRDDFTHIIRCENFVAPLDRIFRYLFQFVGKPVNAAAPGVAAWLKPMRQAHAEFLDSGEYSDGTRTLYEIYRDTMDFDNEERFVESLLESHRKVAAGRRREPWIFEENGFIQSFNHEMESDELEGEPSDLWLNDYYIRPLYNVYRALATP